MARYAIFDGVSNVLTPSGKEFTAKEWLSKYPWGKKAKMVIGGGVINGSLCMVFDEMVSMYVKMGVDFGGCVTDQDYLDRIEEFEDAPTEVEYSDEARIADALEDLVTVQMVATEQTV